jgi:hypothetical protein
MCFSSHLPHICILLFQVTFITMQPYVPRKHFKLALEFAGNTDADSISIKVITFICTKQLNSASHTYFKLSWQADLKQSKQYACLAHLLSHFNYSYWSAPGSDLMCKFIVCTTIRDKIFNIHLHVWHMFWQLLNMIQHPSQVQMQINIYNMHKHLLSICMACKLCHASGVVRNGVSAHDIANSFGPIFMTLRFTIGSCLWLTPH